MTEYEVVRDPLWDNIRIDAAALDVLDTPAMQRLRYVRQLGHAFLVYPGATHTRFEHALGAYHLTRRALANLNERGELAQLDESQRMAARLAALTHDIGHYPFSHTLEEAGFPKHEQLGVAKLGHGELGVLLQRLGGNELVSAIGQLITGQSQSPLKGLISGSLDLDKIDYLSRDARMCGVPYGAVDVDRLLASLALVETERGRIEVGVLEKGISAVESLLFAKYQMYRNVYWHHAVRSATCMFKRAVRAAECSGGLSRDTIAEATDDGLTEKLLATDPTGLARAVHRPLIRERPDLLDQVENRLAKETGLSPGELLLDFPSNPSMLAIDLPLRNRNGAVERLTGVGREGQFGLPRVADELYRSARRLRVFTARPPAGGFDRVSSLVAAPVSDVEKWLSGGGWPG